MNSPYHPHRPIPSSSHAFFANTNTRSRWIPHAITHTKKPMNWKPRFFDRNWSLWIETLGFNFNPFSPSVFTIPCQLIKKNCDLANSNPTLQKIHMWQTPFVVNVKIGLIWSKNKVQGGNCSLENFQGGLALLGKLPGANWYLTPQKKSKKFV